MKLYLVRHGDAVAPHVDPQRPLSPQGVREVEKIAAFLKRADLQLNEIYHSTKTRAKQTAEIFQKEVFPQAKLEEKPYLSPDDDIDQICEELSNRKEDLMVVSHLPFLPALISRLVVGKDSRVGISLATAGVVGMYTENGRDWQIVWVVDPFLLS